MEWPWEIPVYPLILSCFVKKKIDELTIKIILNK